MPEGFRGLEVTAPDVWAPLARLGDFVPDIRGSEDKVGLEIVGRLKPGVSMGAPAPSSRHGTRTNRRSLTGR